ncbi:hydroxymethylbilane synthase [Alphaproteobacteria bacterium]|nr:hydroxymethylbilane synthase [Alphaproteobacteria bacterium]MDC0462108.1 hydroxymethylbilane synthase [Alphaproteobacteria bacterium]MDC3312014.1 hydroxymethylbilane synthase [Alphaproteobacteria bacterium]
MQDKKNSETFNLLKIATRKSSLAMAQAQLVCDLIMPMSAQLVGMSTPGDENLVKPLVDIGGKGVFIKTLERALLSLEADCAVHSMKDMETSFAEDTEIVAVLPREDPRDAILGAVSLDALPINARVGTASVRRKAQLLKHRPDLNIQLLRGNINRRIACLENKEFDAIILAVAGLKRLELNIDYSPIEIEMMPPAASQGTLAVQIYQKHPNYEVIKDIFAPLHCQKTNSCVIAERTVLAGLDGSCRTPISAYAFIDSSQKIHLTGCVYSPDGKQAYQAKSSDDVQNAEALGKKIAQELLKKCGGKSFLAS